MHDVDGQDGKSVIAVPTRITMEGYSVVINKK